jgi:hypothetical protein
MDDSSLYWGPGMEEMELDPIRPIRPSSDMAKPD